MIPNGLKTTEFWLTIAALVVGTIMVVSNHLDGSVFWPWAAGATGAYGISRGLAKTEPVTPDHTAATTPPAA